MTGMMRSIIHTRRQKIQRDLHLANIVLPGEARLLRLLKTYEHPPDLCYFLHPSITSPILVSVSGVLVMGAGFKNLWGLRNKVFSAVHKI